MENKFCIKCGNNISFDSIFCDKCGTRQDDVKKELKSNDINDYVKKQKQEKQATNNIFRYVKSTFKWIGILIVLFIVLLLIVDQCVPDVEDSAEITNTNEQKSTPKVVTPSAPKVVTPSAPKVVTPSAPKSYIKVLSASGKGRQSTDTFQLFGGKVKVISKVKPDLNTSINTGDITFYINSTESRLGGVQFDQSYTDTTMTTSTNYFHALSKGSYYVDSIGSGSDWSIEIYEER